MKYTSFLQLFYEGKNEEYKKRLENAKNDSCYYELPIKINENQAFLFLIPEIYDIINEITETTSRIKEKTPDWLNTIVTRGFLVDEILTTNEIEGVNSSRKDINDILIGVNGNSRLLGLVNRYLILLTTKEIPLSESQDIRAIFNQLVLEEVKANKKDHVPDGEVFRKSMVDVDKPGGRTIHHGVNPESEIIIAMDTALNFLNNAELNVFIKIAVFHYLFGYIHPFYDGNGRVDRFISSYLLCRETDTPLGFRLSYTISNHKKKYYKAFETVNDFRNKGDVTPFALAFLELVNEAAHELIETIDKYLFDLKQYQEIINKIFSGNKKIVELMNKLLESTLCFLHGLSKKDLKSYLNLSVSSVERYIKSISPELLLTETIKKQKYYKLNLIKLSEIGDSL
jgi:Fic family protein